MKSSTFISNDVLIEILLFSRPEEIYPTLLYVNRQFNHIVSNKIFLEDLVVKQKIPKTFIAKYFREISKPSDVLQIDQLWKEQSPIHLSEMIDRGESIRDFKQVTWRMDILQDGLKIAPESTLCCIPVTSTRALFVNLKIPREIFEVFDENYKIQNENGEIMTNFIEVEGDIDNLKNIDGRNYLDLAVHRIDFVTSVETKVRKLPKEGINPLETPFELFYSRFKGKTVQWEGIIDEIVSSTSLTVDEPNLTLYHNQKSLFCEGDCISYRGRIGTLMSIHCDEIKVVKQVSFVSYIQRDLIALGIGTSSLYLLKKLYDRGYTLRLLSQFALCFTALLGLQYNLLYHHPLPTKVTLDLATFYLIWKYWGRWGNGGTHILFMILSGTISLHAVSRLLTKSLHRLK